MATIRTGNDNRTTCKHRVDSGQQSSARKISLEGPIALLSSATEDEQLWHLWCDWKGLICHASL